MLQYHSVYEFHYSLSPIGFQMISIQFKIMDFTKVKLVEIPYIRSHFLHYRAKQNLDPSN